jgi:hypothetical protein
MLYFFSGPLKSICVHFFALYTTIDVQDLAARFGHI